MFNLHHDSACTEAVTRSVLLKRCSQKLCKIHRETAVAGIIKKRLWHTCFSVNFAEFLRTPYTKEQNNSGGCFCMQTSFFYKQPVYKQLAFGWQIAKQLSELNPLSISNNKNYR